MAEHKKHLYYLDELSDYKISDGYPDVRNWDVKDFDNRIIGKVDNLLVNIEAERVVYLDIEVDKSIIDAKYDPYGKPHHTEVREFINKDGENHIIVPIGLVDFNRESKYVYTDTIDHTTFAETKRIRKGDTIRRDYEQQVMDSYGRKTKSVYNDSLVEDKNIYNKIPSEARIREIVREEISNYHNDTDGYYNENLHTDDTVEEAVIISDEGIEDTIVSDDRFYDRREFDDSRFRKK